MELGYGWGFLSPSASRSRSGRCWANARGPRKGALLRPCRRSRLDHLAEQETMKLLTLATRNFSASPSGRNYPSPTPDAPSAYGPAQQEPATTALSSACATHTKHSIRSETHDRTLDEGHTSPPPARHACGRYQYGQADQDVRPSKPETACAATHPKPARWRSRASMTSSAISAAISSIEVSLVDRANLSAREGLCAATAA